MRIVRRTEGKAPGGDLRRRIIEVIAEYKGDDGYEYRKSFQSYNEPIVPEQGTSNDLNFYKEQWSKHFRLNH